MRLRLAAVHLLLCGVMCAQISGVRSQQSISGTVRTISGAPVNNARIEVHDLNTGATVGSAYTNADGRFEVDQLNGGTYDVSAVSGTNEAHERIDARLGDNTVQLRLADESANAAKAGDSASATVSVNQYKVPDKARKAYRKAEEALAKGQSDDADKYLEQALAIYPNYSDALTLRAIRSLDAKKIDAAIDDLDAAIKADGSNARAQLVLGAAFNAQKKYDEAIRITERALSVAPNAWQAYFELAKSYVGKGDYAAGLRQLNKAVENGAPKNYASLHLFKAHVLLALKDYNSAINELELFLNNAPAGEQATQARAMLDQAKAFTAQ